MAINPLAYTETVVRNFLRYQLTTYGFADERLNGQLRELLSLDETRETPLRKGPYVSLSRAFKGGAAIAEMVAEGVLHAHLNQVAPFLVFDEAHTFTGAQGAETPASSGGCGASAGGRRTRPSVWRPRQPSSTKRTRTRLGTSPAGSSGWIGTRSWPSTRRTSPTSGPARARCRLRRRTRERASRRCSRPELLTFETFNAPVDPARWDGGTGRIYERYSAWRWGRDLDLLDPGVDFFAVSRQKQVEILVDFLRESLAIARTLE